MKRASNLNAGLVAAGLAFAAVPAAADPSFTLAAYGAAGMSESAPETAFAGYEETRAPGLESARAFSLSPVAERDLVTPFGLETESFESSHSAPLNGFAGQRERFEPGVLGEALGKAKKAILRGFGQR